MITKQKMFVKLRCVFVTCHPHRAESCPPRPPQVRCLPYSHTRSRGGRRGSGSPVQPAAWLETAVTPADSGYRWPKTSFEPFPESIFPKVGNQRQLRGRWLRFEGICSGLITCVVKSQSSEWFHIWGKFTFSKLWSSTPLSNSHLLMPSSFVKGFYKILRDRYQCRLQVSSSVLHVANYTRTDFQASFCASETWNWLS